MESERIINISELEAINTKLFNESSRLRKELEKESPSMELVKELSKQIHMDAHKAMDFEFFLERRNINLRQDILESQKDNDSLKITKCSESSPEYDAKYKVQNFVIGVSDISFRLPTLDWEKLEESDIWNQMCQFLSGVQKGYSPMYPQGNQDLLEDSCCSSENNR